MRYALVVPAAGAGRRFGGPPKQYAPLAGATVLAHSLAPFVADERCAAIAVALAADDPHWRDPRVAKLRTLTGGDERARSVALALESLLADFDESGWVMVHDGVRPCVTRAEIDALAAIAVDGSPGGLLAVPLADTLKQSPQGEGPEGPPVSARTVPREHLWRALTPQMFRLGELRAALAAAAARGRSPTDEAQAIEWAGGAPRLVTGDARNIKITTPADLALAGAILAARHGEGGQR